MTTPFHTALAEIFSDGSMFHVQNGVEDFKFIIIQREEKFQPATSLMFPTDGYKVLLLSDWYKKWPYGTSKSNNFVSLISKKGQIIFIPEHNLSGWFRQMKIKKLA